VVGRVVPLATSEQAFVDAVAAFLAQPGLARSTRRSYDQTLTRLVHEFGGNRQLSTLTVGGSHGRGNDRMGWAPGVGAHLRAGVATDAPPRVRAVERAQVTRTRLGGEQRAPGTVRAG
jgi:hypothetical protein